MISFFAGRFGFLCGIFVEVILLVIGIDLVVIGIGC